MFSLFCPKDWLFCRFVVAFYEVQLTIGHQLLGSSNASKFRGNVEKLKGKSAHTAILIGRNFEKIAKFFLN